MQEGGEERPQEQEENNASAESEDVSILEYSINPSYKKDSESLSAQAIRDVHSTFDAMTEKGYRSLFEILWYKQLPCFDVRNTTSDKNNQHGMIKYCEWKGRRLPCSALFKTSPSDRGMCCTFNVQEAEKMFQDREYGVSIGMVILYRTSSNKIHHLCGYLFSRLYILLLEYRKAPARKRRKREL